MVTGMALGGTGDQEDSDISLLLTFISAMLFQPNWVYENFWSTADFNNSIPFLVFLIIYAAISTAFAELGIRFIKKCA